jgi:hypothetical protein
MSKLSSFRRVARIWISFGREVFSVKAARYVHSEKKNYGCFCNQIQDRKCLYYAVAAVWVRWGSREHRPQYSAQLQTHLASSHSTTSPIGNVFGDGLEVRSVCIAFTSLASRCLRSSPFTKLANSNASSWNPFRAHASTSCGTWERSQTYLASRGIIPTAWISTTRLTSNNSTSCIWWRKVFRFLLCALTNWLTRSLNAKHCWDKSRKLEVSSVETTFRRLSYMHTYIHK